MRIRGISRIRRGIRRISNLLQNRAIILLYHRVIELRLDPQLLCVTPTHFAEHMEYLRRYYRPISLRDLKQALLSGSIPHRAIAVTFDDGYADNLYNAMPILERYNVPATIFVTTGYVDGNREFFADTLARCLLQPGTLPDLLTLEIDGKPYSWQIGDFKEDSGGWNVLMDFYPTSRHKCYYELCNLLRPLNHAKQQAVVEALAKWASCPIGARSDYRALRPDEIKTLSKSGLVEIGSHGINHLLLEAHPTGVQQKEITESKQKLQEITKQPITSLAYPYGYPDGVAEETIRLVKEAGFEIACANFASPVTVHSDLFWLPRFLVRDWSGQEFAGRLKKVFY